MNNGVNNRNYGVRAAIRYLAEETTKKWKEQNEKYKNGRVGKTRSSGKTV